jgi:hypothetical protein
MNWFDRVAINYIVYTINCNFATHEICLLTFTTYKYSELQRSSVLKNWIARPIVKQPFFHSDSTSKKDHPNHNRHVEINLSKMIELSFLYLSTFGYFLLDLLIKNTKNCTSECNFQSFQTLYNSLMNDLNLKDVVTRM